MANAPSQSLDNLPLAVIGGGVGGLFCALELAHCGFPVIVFEAQDAVGKKLTVAGGGYANITHDTISAQDYACHNPYFTTSALKRFPPQALLESLAQLDIPTHLRERGCWFCRCKAKDLVNRLVNEISDWGGAIQCRMRVTALEPLEHAIRLHFGERTLDCSQVVLACGSLAAPQLGGCDDGFTLAQQLGLSCQTPAPALAPIYFQQADQQRFGHLAGVALDPVSLTVGEEIFTGSLVFRPTGLGGLAVYRATLPWQCRGGGTITLNFAPDINWAEWFADARHAQGKQLVRTALSQHLPKRLVVALIDDLGCASTPLAQLSATDQQALINRLSGYSFTPDHIGDYRESEVMVGGVDTDALSSKTFALKSDPRIFCIGEMMDVTGQLGGYNIHWAYASAHAAAQSIIQGSS